MAAELRADLKRLQRESDSGRRQPCRRRPRGGARRSDRSRPRSDSGGIGAAAREAALPTGTKSSGSVLVDAARQEQAGSGADGVAGACGDCARRRSGFTRILQTLQARAVRAFFDRQSDEQRPRVDGTRSRPTANICFMCATKTVCSRCGCGTFRPAATRRWWLRRQRAIRA